MDLGSGHLKSFGGGSGGCENLVDDVKTISTTLEHPS